MTTPNKGVNNPLALRGAALKEANAVHCGSCYQEIKKWFIYCPMCGVPTLLNKISVSDATRLTPIP